jgi:hypothetical protein
LRSIIRFLDGEFDKLPTYHGIYMFRSCHRKNGDVYPEVIYIGKADQDNGLAGRVNERHEHLADARKYVKDKGEGYYLSISYTDKNDDIDQYDWIARIEAALIYARQPAINIMSTVNFTYDETELHISGIRHLDLQGYYDVKRN